MVERIPLGRMGTADEVATLIAFLASEDWPSRPARPSTSRGGRAVF